MGVISADVTVDRTTATAMMVHIDQVQPTEGVPSFAKKFAGETDSRRADRGVERPDAAARIAIETPGQAHRHQRARPLTESGGRTIQTSTARSR